LTIAVCNQLIANFVISEKITDEKQPASGYKIKNPQPSIPNPQSSILNPQSSLINKSSSPEKRPHPDNYGPKFAPTVSSTAPIT
jgi:hypothetical protein